MATPVILPKQGNSVESCIIQQWLKQPGDSVSAGEAICEVETDKAVMEVEAPADGILLAVFFQADDDVPVLETIAAIGAAGEDASGLRPATGSASAPAAPAPAASPAPVPAPAAPAATNGGAGSSPRARGLATDKGIDVTALSGSGPQGLVIERDVQAAVAAAPKLSPAAQATLAAGGRSAPTVGSGPAGLVRVADLLDAAAPVAAVPVAVAPPQLAASTQIPVKGIRKIIAERMRHSLASTAQLTLHASAKVAALQAYRARLKAQGETLGLPNITLGDMIVFACSRLLPRHPELNAHFLGDRIVRHAEVNIGVAVDTERGLLVPVIPSAQRLSLAALAATFKPMAKACQAGSPDPDQLQGGTFTVTNLGNLGIDSFTPVLNAPEVAILGVGGLQLKPFRAADGAVEHHDVIGLSLTIDHQALDGAPAARFLQALVSALEHFELLLAD